MGELTPSDAEAYEHACLKQIRDGWPAAFENPDHWPGRDFVGAELRGEYPNTELCVTLDDARSGQERTLRLEVWKLNTDETGGIYDPKTFADLAFMWAMEE